MNTQNSITQDFPSAPDVDQDSPQTPQAGSKTGGGNSTNHTPGPWFPMLNTAGTWEVKIAPIYYAQTVATAGPGCPEFFRGDPEANARLIAAAPDLLEALAEIVNADDEAEVEFRKMGIPAVDEHPATAKARAAILKATGKESA